MQLTYRGTTYEYNPPQVETVDGNLGKYRGLDWRFRNRQKSPVIQPTHTLTYRGVKYSNNPLGDVKPMGAPLSVDEKARALMVGQEKANLNREQSMLGRLVDEVGLNASEANHHA
ncbi:MAG: DUF4278 domain-containing protein [Oscillatoriales cyanobacterium RM1_1_9]|nr:DUF4278 domain-containing protein [Oscillatoriales cyanobacterium SM2_3_0]NJO46522.1 DUF4278 domain-containing protein [Oscillatoriales cyanobacterium RM2_1_1]NJO70661.1 DUF4278 domain-containing protein [Oscillatoriales cyanobacterium RM1_1_9]